MTSFYVFKYTFDAYFESLEDGKKTIEKVNTHAVAMAPAENCTVLLGGGSTWVFQTVLGNVDSYLVDGEVHCLEGTEAMAMAKDIQRVLIESGTIAPDPRILKPPKGFNAPLKIAK